MQKPPLPQDPWALIPGADRVVATVSIVQATELSGDPNAIDAFARVWIGKRKMKKLTQVYQNSCVTRFFVFFSPLDAPFVRTATARRGTRRLSLLPFPATTPTTAGCSWR